jgi:NADH dehydrogenase
MTGHRVIPARGATRSDRPQVVIIGGGFGGVSAARRLRDTPAGIILVDRGTSNLFQPLLYQCATGLLSEGQITSPLRELLRRQKNTRVLLAEAVGIDPGERTLTMKRPDGSTLSLPYDYLIVAVGMRQSYFGHDGFARFAPGMKTLDDALAIRRRVYGAFEVAETLPAPELRREWLTFVVVGAGPTGVELAGQIRELATRTLAREFRTIDPAEARVLLLDAGDAPLASFGPGLSASGTRALQKAGVELQMGLTVDDIDAEGLRAKARDGTTTRYNARTVLWTAGVEAVPFVSSLAKSLGVHQGPGGRIAVNPDLRVPGTDNIWVIGDIMSLDKLPGVAEVALQGGLHAGGQIHRLIAGYPHDREVFRYRDLGTAAYINRFHAVVKVGPLSLSGFGGWVIWGFVHMAFLTGARNRVGALTTWMLAIAVGSRRERAVPYNAPGGSPDLYGGPPLGG